MQYLKFFRDTNSNRLSPKDPWFLSHFKTESCLKIDESGPVEAGACLKVLIITLSPKTDSTYRHNNHYQHHHWYAEIFCAPLRFFPPPICPQLFTPVLCNTSETFYQISVACNPDEGFICQKRWHMVTAIVVPW